ncbi:MAG TPA: ClpP-like prohead protease/major capsid protein fusion protein [Luteimonas sp.]
MPQFKMSPRLRAALERARPEASGPAAAAPGLMRVQAAETADTVELLIYGAIGASWWDDESITARSVVEALSGTTASTIEVRINSLGGSVADGIAIHNELRRQAAAGKTVTCTVDGMACSIASLIAAAGDTVRMHGNALQMLHAPWGSLWVDGNAKEVREVAEEFAQVLEVMGKAMSASYARKSGRPASEFDAMWAAGDDHWYTAEEAVEAGLCDEVIDGLVVESEDEDEPGADAAAAVEAFLEQLVESAPQALACNVRAAARRSVIAAARAKAERNPNPPAPVAANPPADAGHTHEETTMPAPNHQTAAPAAISAAVTDAIAALRTRNEEIRALAEPHFGNPEIRSYYDSVIAEPDPSITAADVGKQILALMAKGRGPLGAAGTVTVDERDNRIAGMGAALQARLGHARGEDGNHYRGMTLFDMAAACAQAAGVNTRGMPREDVVRAAITHTSSDFPAITGNAVRTAVLRGYEEFPEVYPEFTRPVSVPDFKKQSLAGLGQFVGIEEVPKGGEYPYGTFSAIGQDLQLKKMGGIFSITDEAIINDDLGLFDSVPQKMGAAAKRALGDRVFALITSNPVLSDGIALFHASHNNLLTGAAPSTAAIDAMIAKMALQRDSAGNPVRVPLKFILAPVGLGGLVRQVLESQFEIGGSTAKANTAPNYVRNRFVVVEDPRLDADSPTAFYGVADPAVVDGIVVAYRDGVREPRVTQREGWNVDGIEFKVRLDAAPGIASHLGLNKNPGA